MDILDMYGITFLPLLAFVTATGTPEYYISDTSETWTAASVSCKLATPDLTYSGKDIFARTSILGLNLTGTLWIGYMKTYGIFQYIGCVETSHILDAATYRTYTIRQDPGRCYSACGNKGYIGLTKTTSECFCLDDSVTVPDEHPETVCTDKCRNPLDTACGGVDHISLYKPVTSVGLDNVTYNNATNQHGECVLYDPDIQQYLWTKCSSSYSTLCQSEQAVEPLSTTASWLGSSIICFQNSLYPMTHSSIQLFDRLKWKPKLALWTGMLRSPVVHDYHDKATPFYAHGYVDMTGKAPTVKFDPAGSNTRRKYICQKDTFSKSNTSSTVEPDKALPDVEQNDSNNSLVIYVGLAAGSLFLIALGLVVYVMWKKWRNNIINNDNAVPVCNSIGFGRTPSSGKITEDITNQDGGHVNNRTNDLNNALSRLNYGHTKQINNDKADHHTLNTDIAPAEFDKDKITDDSIYGITMHDDDGAYDHINIQTEISNGKGTTDQYAKPGAWNADELSNAKAGKSDVTTEIYDACERCERATVATTNTNNIYSHVNLKQNNDKEGVYDTTDAALVEHATDNIYAKVNKRMKVAAMNV